MTKSRKFNKNFTFNLLIMTLAYLITVTASVMGARVQKGYQLQVGNVSPMRFTAPRTVENTVSTQKMRDEAYNSVTPYYTQDESVKIRVLDQLESFFDQAGQQRQENAVFFNPYNETDEDYTPTPTPTPAPGLISHISGQDYDLLMNISDNLFKELEARVYAIAELTLSQSIAEVDAKTIFYVREELGKLDWEVDIQNLGYEIIVSHLEPNRILDEEATRKAREEKAAAVEPDYFIKDQNIVNEGDIITEEIYQVLDSLGLVTKAYAENIYSIAGVVFTVSVLFLIYGIYIYFYNKNLILNKKESLLLFTLLTSIVAITWLLKDAPYQVFPILVFVMLVAMLISKKLAIALNVGLCITSLIIINGDIEFLLFYIITGTFIALISRITTERSKIILVGIMTSIMNFSVMIGLTLIFEKNYSQDMLISAAYAALNGIFSVIISVGTLPIWEAVFGVVTPIKLLDLTNPNSVPLRRLAVEAPGTYHHSLIVANLAETAAYDIGANPNIARVGGYYHDIGKVKYPQYFSENQIDENPHNFMDPQSSVQVITSHVSFGLELAEAAKLPKLIRDMIRQHHGTTLIKYFYYKVLEENPDAEIDEAAFRYHQELPKTKEAAVLMLADTVEAAVRSMAPKGKSSAEIEAFVRELVKDKLDDGQLLESTLTIKDMETVIGSFMRVYKGMYHERIPYPKAVKK